MGNLADNASKRRACRAPLLWAALAVLAAASPTTPAAAGDLRVVLDAEAGVRGDGNYGQTSQLADPELEQDESLARGGFHLQLSYELPRMTLALGYSPSYEWVLGKTDVNGTTHRLDLGLAGNLTRRLQMHVRERLMSSPTLDLYSPFTEAETIAVTPRGDQLTHSLDVALDQSLTRRTSLLLGAAHTLRTFEADDLADTETLSARIGAGFQVAQDRRLELVATEGSYDFGDIEDIGDIADGRNGQSDVGTLSVAWSQPLLRDGRFRIEAGAFSVDSHRVVAVPGTDGELLNQRVEESDTGWRGALELSRQLDLFGWSLGYRHDVSAGAGFGRAVQVDNAFAGVSTRIGRDLFLGLDANASRHRDLSGEASDRSSLVETVAGTARLSWAFSRVAHLNGGYSYIRQDSRVEPFENLSYPRYFLGLAVQLYRSGEEPRNPAQAGEETDDEPVDQ